MTNDQLFAAALGITVSLVRQTVDFDAGQLRLTIHVNFAPGSRFAHPEAPREHPVHDTQIKRLRQLNFSNMNAISKCACRQKASRFRGSRSIGNATSQI
jgi:hypothetical protein